MQDIKASVAGLLESYGTLDPFELCDCLEVKIIKSDLGNDINGFFQRTEDGCEIVHLHSRLDEIETRYTCAHELGHAVLHPDKSMKLFIENKLQIKNKFEIQADKFAAELLLNTDLEDYICEGMNADQLSSLLCVPKKLLRYKYHLDI
ncbi:MAG: ImmA/IrrE family metallo-endopeptidase [Bacteroidales bacterium]